MKNTWTKVYEYFDDSCFEGKNQWPWISLPWMPLEMTFKCRSNVLTLKCLSLLVSNYSEKQCLVLSERQYIV